jgi:hypothetical protein
VTLTQMLVFLSFTSSIVGALRMPVIILRVPSYIYL